jgi:hypothetical protein
MFAPEARSIAHDLGARGGRERLEFVEKTLAVIRPH